MKAGPKSTLRARMDAETYQDLAGDILSSNFYGEVRVTPPPILQFLRPDEISELAAENSEFFVSTLPLSSS
ncbi:hypothetical protein Ciccas_007278 [Cichlidogyrus casuarinus]|uniref:Uncharacterized protein n=1 Tax=Cichlidogyrus casuarinus TaxID=1844966 RepID=A0ABD2Q4H5_9PLAT